MQKRREVQAVSVPLVYKNIYILNINMSYFQQQELLLEQLRTPKQLERYIGVVDRLSGNINLFLDKTDLQRNEYYVKYLAVSTVRGPQNKLMFYGLYDTVQHIFHVHDGCKYTSLRIYSNVIDRHTSYRGYISAGYVSDNKIGETLSKYVNPALYGKAKLIGDDDKYRLFKFIYSYHEGRINLMELRSVYDDNIIDDFNQRYPDYATDIRISRTNLERLSGHIRDYEKDVNFSAPSSDGMIFNVDNMARDVYQLPDIGDRVRYINNEFKYAMSRTDFFEFYQEPCPTIQECRDNETKLCGIYYYGEGEYIERMPKPDEGYNIYGVKHDRDESYHPYDYSFMDGNVYDDDDDDTNDDDLL